MLMNPHSPTQTVQLPTHSNHVTQYTVPFSTATCFWPSRILPQNCPTSNTQQSSHTIYSSINTDTCCWYLHQSPPQTVQLATHIIYFTHNIFPFNTVSFYRPPQFLPQTDHLPTHSNLVTKYAVPFITATCCWTPTSLFTKLYNFQHTAIMPHNMQIHWVKSLAADPPFSSRSFPTTNRRLSYHTI
jgi:hypothetical protein